MIRKRIQLGVYFLLLVASSFYAQHVAGAVVTKTITLAQINDLHAYLVPHMDLVSANDDGTPTTATKIVERGGLARIATVVEQIRQQNPNTLVMNVGDTFYGGIEATYTTGNAIVPAVNALNIDVGVPGNWDFAFGPYVTRARYAPQRLAFLQIFQPWLPKVATVNFPNLTANVAMMRLFLPPVETLLPATMMFTVDGIEVGFIGITSDIVPRMHAMLALGLRFTQGEDNYRKLINQHSAALRAQGAHIVVVMSELGTHKNYQLAQIIEPGVDVIFSAHTHETIFQPLTAPNGTVVVESGNDGYVGRMDIGLDGTQVVAKDWRLIVVDHTIAENAEVKRLVDEARAPFLDPNVNMRPPISIANQRLTQPIDTIVGYTDHFLSRRGALENSFNNVYTDLLRGVANTDVALVPGFRFGANIAAPGYLMEDGVTVAEGAITLEDVYRFFPMSFPMYSGTITGENLKKLLEKGLVQAFSHDHFNHSGGWLGGMSGLAITVDLTQPDGQKVVQIRDADTDQVIGPTDVVSVSSCRRPLEAADRMCDFAGFTQIKPVIDVSTGKQINAIDSLLETLAVAPLSGGDRVNITDLSQTPVWPNAVFVQPLLGEVRP